MTEPDTPAPDRSPERRRARRIPVEAIVHYQIGTREYLHLSSDISAEGIFIKNFSPPPVDTELTIQVRLPEDLGGHEVELLGQVVRVNQGSDVPEPGMGVRFTAVQACSPEAVHFFVNEVYEMDHLERLLDDASPNAKVRFSAAAQDVVRLRSGASAGPASPAPGSAFTSRRTAWLLACLLVGLGALLGAAAVWVFWLGA